MQGLPHSMLKEGTPYQIGVPRVMWDFERQKPYFLLAHTYYAYIVKELSTYSILENGTA